MVKTIKTIEGNTSDKSHSNGGTVQAKTRNWSVIMGVGRPAYAASASAPVAAEPAEKPVEKPAAAVPAQKTAAQKTYTVKSGDSYWAIAAKHPIAGLSTSEVVKILQKLNGNKALHPNDKILIK